VAMSRTSASPAAPPAPPILSLAKSISGFRDSPARAGSAAKDERPRREYVRVTLRKGVDGALEAVKFPREGAGLLSSLADTDGLVELGEDLTQVTPGQSVGFLAYAALIN